MIRLPIVAGFALVMTLTACSSLRRSPRSGYADEGRGSNERATESASADLGSDQIENLAKRRRLRQLESNLESRREREQYSKVLPWLKSDDEKIEFLSIEGLEARQAWIQSKDIWKRSQTTSSEIKGQIESGDISVGMVSEQVKKSWGEPQSVEVSGNPLYRNERWKYVRFVSSADGYRQEKRFVYFEGGRVVGWETE